MNDIVDLMPEFRINEVYSKLYYSNYENQDVSKESTPIIKKKTIFTENFIKKISDKSDVGLMPPNCRYIEQVSNGTIVIIEEPPAIRTINLQMNLEGELYNLRNSGKLAEYGYKEEEYKKSFHSLSLAFPYVLFMLYIDEYFGCRGGQVFVRPAQMVGLSDYLCKIPLTNINESQSVCFGDFLYKKERSLLAAVQHSIMVFWSAQFNTDYTYNYKAYSKTPILNSYIEWKYFSQTNPMFIYNAEWIKHKNNISQQLKSFKDYLNVTAKNALTYNDLSNIFHKSLDSGEEKKVSEKSRKSYKLYHDLCQGIYLNNDVYINVGDTITMKNGNTAFIDSFSGFINGGDIKYIQMDSNGNKFSIKHTPKAIEFLTENILKQKRATEAKLKNGAIIKPGDIIKMKENGYSVFRKIDYIRKSRGEADEILEAKIGKYYYFINNIEAEIVDIKNLDIFNTKLISGNYYIVSKEYEKYSVFVNGLELKFDTLDITESSTLIAIFSPSHNITIGKINSDSSTNAKRLPVVIAKEDVREMGDIFRVGRKIVVMRDIKETVTCKAWSYNGRVVYDNSQYISDASKKTIKLLNNGNFFIKGNDFDTTFDIGDKVVVANWKTPLDVLNIKTITGFKHDVETGNISFILSNKNEELEEVMYVEGRHANILTGKIRKVTNKYENLTVGTKIIAKEASIAGFPKKDINIIVAIIIDGPYEPLILCSNGCTLWYSTVMEKFEHISMKALEWKNLQHVPLDLSKIKFQAGDIINGQSEYQHSIGYLLFYPVTSKTIRALPLNTYLGDYDSYSFDQYFMSDAIFDCIPNPRINQTKIDSLGLIEGFNDFHNATMEYKGSGILFINERGK